MPPSLHAARLARLNDQTRLPSGAQLLIALAVLLTRWDRHRRTRKELSRLEPYLLKDVGLSRDAAFNEARKPFWRD